MDACSTAAKRRPGPTSARLLGRGQAEQPAHQALDILLGDAAVGGHALLAPVAAAAVTHRDHQARERLVVVAVAFGHVAPGRAAQGVVQVVAVEAAAVPGQVDHRLVVGLMAHLGEGGAGQQQRRKKPRSPTNMTVHRDRLSISASRLRKAATPATPTAKLAAIRQSPRASTQSWTDPRAAHTYMHRSN